MSCPRHQRGTYLPQITAAAFPVCQPTAGERRVSLLYSHSSPASSCFRTKEGGGFYPLVTTPGLLSCRVFDNNRRRILSTPHCRHPGHSVRQLFPYLRSFPRIFFRSLQYSRWFCLVASTEIGAVFQDRNQQVYHLESLLLHEPRMKGGIDRPRGSLLFRVPLPASTLHRLHLSQTRHDGVKQYKSKYSGVIRRRLLPAN